MTEKNTQPNIEPVVPLTPFAEWLNERAREADQEAFDLDMIEHGIVPGPTTEQARKKLERRIGGLAAKQLLLEDFKGMLKLHSADAAGKLLESLTEESSDSDATS